MIFQEITVQPTQPFTPDDSVMHATFSAMFFNCRAVDPDQIALAELKRIGFPVTVKQGSLLGELAFDPSADGIMLRINFAANGERRYEWRPR